MLSEDLLEGLAPMFKVDSNLTGVTFSKYVVRFLSDIKSWYFLRDEIDNSSMSASSFLLFLRLVELADRKAAIPNFKFSLARLAVEYLSEITSPCSVYRIWFEIVPSGWESIEL